MSTSRAFVSVCVLVGLLVGTVCAVTIETVPVGNPGNAGDTRYPDTNNYVFSFGAVNHTYNIGKYEVTVGQYTAFLNSVAGVDTYGIGYAPGITRSGAGTVSNPYTYSVDPAFVNRPVEGASWGSAARFANWLHNGQPTGAQGPGTTEDGAYFLNGARTTSQLMAVNRKSNWKWAIASEDEWYKAAYYNPTTSSFYDYPTGSNMAPGRNLHDASGNNANYVGTPYPIDSPYYTTVVGQFRNSLSPYGTYDQGGNVSELTEGRWGTLDRALRGGSFAWDYSGDVGADSLLASYRGYADPAMANITFGFRVVAVPEPATMAILAFGAVGMLARRRRTQR